MNLLAVSALWLWLPVVLSIFAIRPAREATLFSFLFAWLFLPNIAFDLPGIPDWTKMSATVIGTLLGVMLFDMARLLAFRPRWYDLPMAVWCASPFASSMAAGPGAYDGLSAVLDQFIAWGGPYLLGRVYFSDLEGARRLALGVVVGGLVYVPFCLVEIRLSPVFLGWVYGGARWEGTRYGGFRPRVFLATGLELGMWMTFSTLVAQRLWACGSVKQLRGYPFGWVTVALAATTLLCRSTGALVLLVFALAVFWSVRLTGRSWAAWAMLLIAPTFCFARTADLWSGTQAVEIALATVGEERAQSLEFRFLCEANHIAKALTKPILGFSRSGFVSSSSDLHMAVIDGFWIITLGVAGIVGLATLNAMMMLPLALLMRRFPVKSWSEPQVAPAIALGFFLVIFMIDCLSNAMLNPVYALAMGALTGTMPTRRGSNREETGSSLAAAEEYDALGRRDEAEFAYRRAVELSAPGPAPDAEALDIHASALDGLARSLMSDGCPEGAEPALREALAVRLELASLDHDAGRLGDLATAHEKLARALSGAGRAREAIEERRRALDLWSTLVASRPRDDDYRARRVVALNDLAWLLACAADPSARDPAVAVDLATEAARQSPADPACWNTLGVARYRSGDWAGAVEALHHAVGAGPGGGTGFDHYFLSMACLRLGEVDQARLWFDRAVDWTSRYRPDHPGLASFRDEAAVLFASLSGKHLARK